MKDYSHYTEEDIEDLARECERLAEDNATLRGAFDLVIETNKELMQTLDRLITKIEGWTKGHPRSEATPRKVESAKPESGFDDSVPF